LGCAAYSRKGLASITGRERNHIACLQSINRFAPDPRHLARFTAVAIKLQDFLLHIVAPVLRFPVVILAPILPTTLQVGFLPTNFIQQVHLASSFVHHLLRLAKKDFPVDPQLALILEMFDYFPLIMVTVTQTFLLICFVKLIYIDIENY
jgi:hypothetical protein